MVDIDEKGQELVLRRIFATVLIVLGLAIAGAGIASGTIWRADEQVTATLPQDPEAPVVVAGGNVLATVNPNVTVTVTAPDADTPLVLAMGREADVRAWLGESPYEEVTGLTDWETLAVESSTDSTDATEDPSASEDSSGSGEPSEDPSGSGEPSEDVTDEGDAPAEATVPDPAGSDLWIEEVTDTGELTYEWSQVDGRWMMLVASDGSQPAPTVSMTWTREVTTPLMVPGMIIGGVIFLIGLVWLVIELLIRREERRARRRGTSADEAAPAVATTHEDGTPLTRRQIREAARTGTDSSSASAAAGAESATDAADEGTASAATPADATAADAGSWTAIISGAPDEARTAEADAEQETDAAPSPVSGATDLDDWVRSGRTGGEAGPVSTYESPAPGRGLEAEPTSGSGATTWRGTETDDQTEAEDRPRRWWRRRGKSETGADRSGAASASAVSPARPAEPSEGSTDDASEANPQASGASWRQTWGLSSDSDQPTDAQPAESDADADDRGDDEEVDR